MHFGENNLSLCGEKSPSWPLLSITIRRRVWWKWARENIFELANKRLLVVVQGIDDRSRITTPRIRGILPVQLLIDRDLSNILKDSTILISSHIAQQSLGFIIVCILTNILLFHHLSLNSPELASILRVWPNIVVVFPMPLFILYLAFQAFQPITSISRKSPRNGLILAMTFPRGG